MNFEISFKSYDNQLMMVDSNWLDDHYDLISEEQEGQQLQNSCSSARNQQILSLYISQQICRRLRGDLSIEAADREDSGAIKFLCSMYYQNLPQS